MATQVGSRSEQTLPSPIIADKIREAANTRRPILGEGARTAAVTRYKSNKQKKLTTLAVWQVKLGVGAINAAVTN